MRHLYRTDGSLQLLQMISHATLYNLANVLGSVAIILTVVYHFVAVNAKALSKGAGNSGVISAATGTQL